MKPSSLFSFLGIFSKSRKNSGRSKRYNKNKRYTRRRRGMRGG